MERPEVRELIERSAGDEETLAVLLQGNGYARMSDDASRMAHSYITGERSPEDTEWDPS